MATPESRCTAAEIDAICKRLDRFEVVEPEEFVEPVSWWSGIEAGRVLLHRGIDQPAERSIFGSCFFAPLWIAQQSVTVYWGLFDRIRGAQPSARRESLESLGLAVVDAEHRQ